MTHTRAELDHKIGLLEERARELTPRAYAQRHMPEYAWERVIGSALTLLGLKMAWGTYQKRRNHRVHVRQAMAAYGRW